MLDNQVPRVKSKYFVFTPELILPLIIIITLATMWIIAFRTKFFTVKNIECVLDYQPCENNSVQAELDKLKGQNIFALQEAPVRSRLTAGDYTIRELSIIKHLPDKIKVDMQSVYPVSAIHLAGTDNWVVLNQDKRIIAVRHEPPNVPEVLVSELPAVQVGKILDDPKLHKAVDSALLVSSDLPSVKSITLNGDILELHLPDSKIGILTLARDLSTQIHILQVVLSDSTMMKDVRTVDVRFSQPVLK